MLLKTPGATGAVEDTMCGHEGTISAGPIGGTDIRSGGTLHSLPAPTCSTVASGGLFMC